jgi:hypothetical protein
MSNILTDFDFTNQNFNRKDVRTYVRKNFPQCKLDDNELDWMTTCGYISKISCVVLLAKLQQESDIIENNDNIIKQEEKWYKAMGCRLYSHFTKTRREKYWGFFNQVKYGAAILRWNFDDYEYGNGIELLYKPEKGKMIWPQNAGTYSLYVYCPSWGSCHNPETRSVTIGNARFAMIFSKYKTLWIKQFGGF